MMQRSKTFEMKDLGPLWYLLGIEIARIQSMISLSQRKYTLDLLKDTRKLGSRQTFTPMDSNLKQDATYNWNWYRLYLIKIQEITRGYIGKLLWK